MVKLDVVTLSTVPDAPPEAGPERALDPRPLAVAEGDDVAVAEEEAAVQPAESPITAHISAAATISPLLLFDSNRGTLRRYACVATVTEADGSGEDAGDAASAPSALQGTDGPDVRLEAGRAGTVSWGLAGSKTFMMAVLLVRQLLAWAALFRGCRPFL
jgi:hypothetical protein